MEIKLLEIINIEEIKDPIMRTLNEFAAIKYSEPKRSFIINSGKKNIKIKIGKFIIKIHLPICLEVFLINSNFFKEYSFVIKGKKSWRKISGAILNNIAMGTAELYSPTSVADLKKPKAKESIQ